MKIEKLKPMDKRIFWLTVILGLIGLVIISSASVVLSFQRFGQNNYYFFRQIVFFLIGLAAMLLISRIDYHIFKRYSGLILLLSTLLLAAVLIPGIGFKVGNSRRWIDLGFSLLQPSELVKLSLIVYLAAWFEQRNDFLPSFYQGLLPPLAVTGLLAALIILEPDFGSMAVIILIAFVMFFAGGARLTHLLSLVGFSILSGWVAIQAAPYRLERVFTFLNPSEDRLGAAYHINQALLAIGSGGWWGLGFGHSQQKFNFLPEPIGDSIFAIMSEELGFIRVAVILLLFLALILYGLKLAPRAPDKFGSLIITGVISWILIQTILNVSAIVGLLPLTGLPLPFISYGGSSIISLMMGVGFILNISRYKS